MIPNLSIVVHAFTSRILMSFSVDETLLPRHVNLSTRFSAPLFCVKLSPFWLNRIYSVLSVFTWRLIPHVACSRLCSRDLVWVGIFVCSTKSSVKSKPVLEWRNRLLLAFQKLNLRSYGKQRDRCEVRQMNPTWGQQHASPGAGPKSPTGQRSGTHSSVKQLQLHIYKGGVYCWDNIQPSKDYHDFLSIHIYSYYTYTMIFFVK